MVAARKQKVKVAECVSGGRRQDVSAVIIFSFSTSHDRCVCCNVCVIHEIRPHNSAISPCSAAPSDRPAWSCGDGTRP